MVIKFSKKSSSVLRAQANRVLVGGVDSPVRAFRYAGVENLIIERGKGARVRDIDGHEYIDFVSGYGAIILGHGHTKIVTAADKAFRNGSVFGATNESEIRLATMIRDAVPVMQKVRFVNSGTEAVMSAIRLARGVTGRKLIVKFTDSYHGHADQLLVGAGSGVATLGIPASKGVPEEFTNMTIPINRKREDVEAAFKRYGRDIAALIIEPVGGNWGVIEPDLEFLRFLARRTSRIGALLIADEVITGFRFGYGAFTLTNGIMPDIICLGKIIGGGLPIGAYGASEQIMAQLAPEGEVYQGSTFGGNAPVMAAGVAALEELKARRNDHARLEKYARMIAGALISASRGKVTVAQYGPMFSLRFTQKKDFQQFYAGMLKAGVYLAPSEYEANFVSFAHTCEDIERTVKAIRKNLNT